MFGRLDRCIIQRSCLYHLLGIPITQRTALVDSCLVSILRFSQVLRGQFVGLNSHCFSLSLERRAKRDSPSNLLRIFDFDEEWTQLQVRLEGPTIWSHGFTFVASVFSRLCHQCSVYTGCLFDRINERWAMNANKCWPDSANKTNDELATDLAALRRSLIRTIELSQT